MTPDEYGCAYTLNYRKTVAYLLRRQIPDPEEYAQAAWVRGWEKIGTLRNPECVGFWVIQIAFNQFRRDMRGYTPRTMERQVNPALWEVADRVKVKYEAEMQARMDLERGLSRSSKAAWLRMQLQGYSREEIAAQTGITENGVGMHLCRARTQVRNVLSGQGTD